MKESEKVIAWIQDYFEKNGKGCKAVIGISGGTIGEMLYQAKIYLETADLLAWTVMILVLSYVFEKLFLRMLDMAGERLKRMQISESRRVYKRKNISEGRIRNQSSAGEKSAAQFFLFLYLKQNELKCIAMNCFENMTENFA